MNDRSRKSPDDLLEYGFKVTGAWINMKTKTTMKCLNCGDERLRRPSNIKNDGARCSCTKKKMKELKTKQVEFRNLVESQGYKLFDEYTRSDIHVLVQCEKGHPPYKVLPLNFKANRRCKKCADIRISGDQNINWNPNISDKDRKKRRNIARAWAGEVKSRDKFTCQNPICGHSGKGMVAHHLYSWETCDEKRLDINNGVTLCDNCHSRFHMLFGKTNNTKEQYLDWIKLELNQTKTTPRYSVVEHNKNYKIIEIFNENKNMLGICFKKKSDASKLANYLNKNAIKFSLKQ